MNITCPCCAARYSIEAAFTDDAARAAVAAALKLPAPLGEQVLRYIALFRPAQRALSWDRATKLLEELQVAISTAQVQRHGRAWAAPLDTWKTALDEVLARRGQLQLPLKTHGYLFEIVAGIASKAEGRQERQAEEQVKYRPRESSGQPVAVAQYVGRERGLEMIRDVKDLVKRGN